MEYGKRKTAPSPVAPTVFRFPFFVFLLKVARPGFWSTTIWFYFLPLGQRHVFGDWTFWLGLLYVTFPLGLLLYGWNDLGDRETDRFNPRKDTLLFGARGSATQLAHLPSDIALAQAPFVLLFTMLLGAWGLLWFGAMLLANALYNNPRYPFKAHPPLDMLNQVGYLLVFPLSSWLNGVPQLPPATYVFSALFAMHSHLFGQILDLAPDGRAGRHTTAILLGTRRAKWLLALMLLSEAALIAAVFHNWIISGFLALSAAWFVLDVGVLYGEKSYPQLLVRVFALGLNGAAIGSLWWMWSTGALTHLPVGN